MITGSDKWYTVAERIRTAVHNELSTVPERSGVVPGAIAWDACDCGILAVSIAQVYLSDVFPDDLVTRTAAAGCDAAWEVGELVIQVIRCAPNPPGQQLHPTVVALDDSARLVAIDAFEALKSTSVELCQMREARDVVDFMIRPQVVQGPEGGCVGSELRVWVALHRN